MYIGKEGKEAILIFVEACFLLVISAEIMIYGWQVTTLWVNCPLYVSKLGQLNRPSF